jgi:hypothetical protein
MSYFKHKKLELSANTVTALDEVKTIPVVFNHPLFYIVGDLTGLILIDMTH